MMKLWIDDVRRPPSDDWIWCQTVNGTKTAIREYERDMCCDSIMIDLDHDAGNFVKYGGDYIEILNWLEREGIVDIRYSFHIHSMNPVGVQNMKSIIDHNNWRLA